MAEGVGFEPTVGCPTLDFESSALNRTQPPFPEAKRNLQSPTLNVQRSTSNPPSQTLWRGRRRTQTRFRIAPSMLSVGSLLVRRVFLSGSKNSEKSYNFRLAMRASEAAYCVSARTVTLLLVVDWNSQVVSAAVHDYSHAIQKLNPPSPP